MTEEIDLREIEMIETEDREIQDQDQNHQEVVEIQEIQEIQEREDQDQDLIQERRDLSVLRKDGEMEIEKKREIVLAHLQKRW